MSGFVRLRIGIASLALLLAAPHTLSAQTSGIVGTVTDTSGAVLPGVTVEASSPALIEKVRTATTDERGLYQIGDVRPGVYDVTFTLAGFSAVKREAIEVPAGFIATVNIQLRVGTLEETITVTGETPIVDVQSARVQTTVSKDVLAAIPAASWVECRDKPGPSTAGTRRARVPRMMV